VRNRGIGRARMFMGGLLLFAAVIAWFTSFMMSPHGDTVARGTEHVKTTVVIFMRNSAIGTLVLCALAGWLLFPLRRPKWPRRDYAILGIIAVLVLSSIYDLVWLQISVLH
jgi:drug/metabolite transporter (DMT)-like permease